MKKTLRFSLASFFVFVAALSLFVAPLVARRNHVEFFKSEQIGEGVRVEWHHNRSSIGFGGERTSGEKVPLDRWFGETSFQGLTRTEKWTISQQVESITMYTTLSDKKLKSLGARIPRCHGLVAFNFRGNLPAHFANSLKRSDSLGIFSVSECDDCQHVASMASEINNLQALMFADCELTEQDMEELASCHGLQFLAFSGSAIAPEWIEKLRRQLPTCQISKL